MLMGFVSRVDQQIAVLWTMADEHPVRVLQLGSMLAVLGDVAERVAPQVLGASVGLETMITMAWSAGLCMVAVSIQRVRAKAR